MIDGLRTRTRSAIVHEITAAARRQLAEAGAANLSVRAVTRELGMAPSSVYRYFANRDALLTELIVQAYDGVGAAAEAAEAAYPRRDYASRWIGVFRAVRAWALAHPHEYALIYGSPVPGYEAPETTVRPATRVVLVLARVAIEAAAGPGLTPTPGPAVGEGLRRDAEARAAEAVATLPEAAGSLTALDPAAVVAVIDAWTLLFGAVSFELFGHYVRTIEARAEHLDHVARTAGTSVGIPGL